MKWWKTFRHYLPKIKEHSKIMAQYGGCSSMAEHLTVDQEVVGSTPISHPETRASQGALFILAGVVADDSNMHFYLPQITYLFVSPTNSLTLPTCPSARRTLMPCGCVLDFVKRSLTIPSVNLPVP